MEKIKDFVQLNARVIVITLLVVAVVIAISTAGSNDDSNETDVANEEVPGMMPIQDEEKSAEPAVAPEEDRVGSQPIAGPVAVEKDENTYTSSAREGDNQTVVVRQMVTEYLADNDKSLNKAQRLFMETNLVNTLPRNDVIQVGETITLDQDTVNQLTDEAVELSDAAQQRWLAYL